MLTFAQRAMGLLGLLNLVQFAHKYPKTATHVLKLSNHVTYWFPFAITVEFTKLGKSPHD